MAEQPKLHTLDAMRWVAALAVAAYHFVLLDDRMSPYLAVDFFFALSGFVIAYSYDARLSSGMTTGQFVLRRLVRLYPLYVLGLVLGLAATYMFPSQSSAFGSHFEPALQLLTGLIFMPYLSADPEMGIAPLNGPYWSLIVEFHINVAFALLFRWLSLRVMIAVLAVFGVLIVAAAFSYGALRDGHLLPYYHVAIARVTFSFCAGVLACRLRHHVRLPRLHWTVVLALTGITFVVPTPEEIRWIYDSICAIVIFPALILLGAAAQPTSLKIKRLFIIAGGASYALYALHMPFQYAWQTTAEAHQAIPFRVWALPFLALSVATAIVADRFYDIPVRRWLANRLAERRERLARPRASVALRQSFKTNSGE